MKITHDMIAQKLGVSQGTVSKALRDAGGVSEEQAARIRQTAEQMGYFREKKKRQSRRAEFLYPHVAVLVPEIISYYYASAVTDIQNRIESIGGTVQIHLTHFDSARFQALIDRLNRESFADFILSFADYPASTFSRLPIGYMLSAGQNEGSFRIYHEGDIGYHAAISHLSALGHRDIAFIGELNTLIKQRYFCRAMELHGLPLPAHRLFLSSSRFETLGYDGVMALFASPPFPTAIVTAYDEVAFGAIRQLRAMGLRVPEDVSVVGYNDIPNAALFDPPLTTIRSYDCECHEAAVRLICTVLEGRELPPEERIIHFTPTLIVRGSTGPARKNQSL